MKSRRRKSGTRSGTAVNRVPIVYVVIIIGLLGVIAVMGYVFLLTGATVRNVEDPRVGLVLEEPERTLVLTEMRGFLAAVQAITEAVARDDVNAIASAARPMGMAAVQGVPVVLAAKLPLEFKRLGHRVHADFDRIALDAESLGDGRHALVQLGEILKQCVACHAGYRIVPAARAGERLPGSLMDVKEHRWAGQ